MFKMGSILMHILILEQHDHSVDTGKENNPFQGIACAVGGTASQMNRKSHTMLRSGTGRQPKWQGLLTFLQVKCTHHPTSSNKN
jgi:hypothetical protein